LATRLENLKTRIQMYYNAEIAILEGAQSYKIGSRELSRVNMSYIRDQIVDLEKEIAIEESKTLGKGRNRMFGVIPRDF
jgi:hypothetical protein